MKVQIYLVAGSAVFGLLVGTLMSSPEAKKSMARNLALRPFENPDRRKALIGMQKRDLVKLLGDGAQGCSCDGTTCLYYPYDENLKARTCKFLSVTFKSNKATSAEVGPGDIFGGINRNPAAGDILSTIFGISR